MDTPPARTISGRILQLSRGDITQVPADAIVNAANSELSGGGGVDGAIHRVGGPSIMAELRDRYRGCPTGEAVWTAAGNLPASWVIHAVGPVWRGGAYGEDRLLSSAYRSAMVLATALTAQHVTFPAISCGIYGYPLAAGARVALETVAHELIGETPVERVTFVLRSADVFEAFEGALERLRAR